MPQVVECGECGKKLRASDELAGLKVRCPRCQSIVRVPGARNDSLDDLDLLEPVDPPVPAPPAGDTSTPRSRRKNRSRNASVWPSSSRWWTLLAGVLLAALTFFLPQVGMVIATLVGAVSALVMMFVVLVLAGPIIIEHPFLVLQLLIFRFGISHHTQEQRRREAARIRPFWPALSQSCLGLIIGFVAIMTGGNSPYLPKNSPFAFKQNRPPQAVAGPAVPVAAADRQDLPEADAVLPEAALHQVGPRDWPHVPNALPTSPRLGATDPNVSQLDAAAPNWRGQNATQRPRTGLPKAPPPTWPAPQIEFHQLPTVPGDIQATIRARQRALEMHQERLFHQHRRRQPVPINPPESSTPTPANPQPTPVGPRGGL